MAEKKIRKSGKTSAKKSVSGDSQGGKGTFTAALKGIGVGLGITCIIFAVCALILTYTDADESFTGIVSTVSTALSAVAAGFITAKNRGKNGLVTGMLAGLAYGVILLAISAAAGGGPVSLSSLACLVTAIAGGGIGGILGVNYSR